MRDSYIKDVKGRKLRRFSAFLADREWNAAGGVSYACCMFVCVCACVCVWLIVQTIIYVNEKCEK